VVKVEVGDCDRVEVGPLATCPQERENARAAVEQELTRALDEVAGLGATRVRPGRRRADYRDLHGRMFAGLQAESLSLSLTSMVAPASVDLLELSGSLSLALLLPR
jgi:hypothetical protein